MIRLLPFMIQERNKLFSYKDCRFAVEKEKENTARIVIFKELGIINTYTLEASFYGGEALGKVVYKEETSSDESELPAEEDEEIDGEDEEEEDEDEPDNDNEDNIDLEELEQEKRLTKLMIFDKSTKLVSPESLLNENRAHYNSESETKKIKQALNTSPKNKNKIKLPAIEPYSVQKENKKSEQEKPKK